MNPNMRHVFQASKRQKSPEFSMKMNQNTTL